MEAIKSFGSSKSVVVQDVPQVEELDRMPLDHMIINISSTPSPPKANTPNVIPDCPCAHVGDSHAGLADDLP